LLPPAPHSLPHPPHREAPEGADKATDRATGKAVGGAGQDRWQRIAATPSPCQAGAKGGRAH